MPVKTTDLNAAIATIVAEQVAASIAPYRGVLDRMAALFGNATAAKEPAALRARRRPERRVAKRRGRTAKTAASAAPVNFDIGQSVMYRQGRGAFDAKVVKIAGDTLTLERTKDGAKVNRPAAKVIAA